MSHALHINDAEFPVLSPLASALLRMELHFALKNDPIHVYGLVSHLRGRLAAFDSYEPVQVVRVGIALEEVLLNALYHGNLELSADELQQASAELVVEGRAATIVRRQQSFPYRNRRIHVHADLSRDEAAFVVRDEGPGFDVAARLPLVVSDKPRDWPRGRDTTRPRGRGLELIHAFMDVVRFNQRGNEVCLAYRRKAG